jgi:hypothetical protein
MDFATTPTAYNGGLENPKPGKFAKILIKDDEDPPHAEIIVGVDGLPRMFRMDRWLVATVAS